MISNKIKAVYQFVDFLHGNIENFEKHLPKVYEYSDIGKEMKNLNPDKSFTDREQYNKLLAIRKPLFTKLNENLIEPIKQKALKLHICTLNKYGELEYSWGLSQIYKYQKQSTRHDRDLAMKHKQDYLKVRIIIQNFVNLFSPFFISDLDRNLKELFCYFDENTANEFEEFENKPLWVSNNEEAIKGSKEGNTKQKSELNKIELSEKITKLKTIWLPEAKITVEDFLKKGCDNGLWNNYCKIITKKNSLYGTGKTMLGSIFIAFKGWAIHSHTDYKAAGKVLCEIFNIKNKETTKEPYKAFSSGNPKTVREIKRVFGVR